MCNDLMSAIANDGNIPRPLTPSGGSERSPSPALSLVTGGRKRAGSSSSTNNGVLGSLLKQTIKVTTASMGLRAASMERYVGINVVGTYCHTVFN